MLRKLNLLNADKVSPDAHKNTRLIFLKILRTN